VNPIAPGFFRDLHIALREGRLEPAVYLAVLAVVALAPGLALWFPARRAAKINPVEAPRCERKMN